MIKNILVVDDEENIREIITEFLDTLGYNVISARDGEEALRMCTKYSFDLVITDIRMPKLNGLKLLQMLKQIFPTLPVILMTGYQPSKSQEEAMTTKADAYLLKPFSLSSLRDILLKVIKRYDK
jgi:two-component system NtrC family response regulator